jgi:formate dehydrogenase maturation protein FdhE
MVDGQTSPELQSILARLEAVRGRPHVSEEYVDFRTALLQAQYAVRVDAGAGTDALSKEEDPGAVSRAISLPIERTHFLTLLQTIAEQLPAGRREAADAERIRAAADADPQILEEMIVYTTCPLDWKQVRELGARLEVDPGTLVFVGRMLGAPLSSLIILRSKLLGLSLAPRPDHGEVPGYCPVCGSTPGLACVSDASPARTLCCSLCGHWWEFARLTCPSCGNSNRDTLCSLTIGDEDPHWIEACDECRGYVKTTAIHRLSATEPFIPLVEEAATLHLDQLAQREGYRQRLPYAALS